jgi:hypothetical protein
VPHIGCLPTNPKTHKSQLPNGVLPTHDNNDCQFSFLICEKLRKCENFFEEMPKLHVVNVGTWDISELEDTDPIMENKVGVGGGQHLMLDIWDSNLDDPSELKHLRPVVKVIMSCFTKLMPDVKIRNYRVEHRVYVLDAEPFVGMIHDDSCEYSAIFYYRIDDSIRGGPLLFYDDEGSKVLETYQPVVGDIVILNGVHAVGSVHAEPSGRRTIIILQINSEEN